MLKRDFGSEMRELRATRNIIWQCAEWSYNLLSPFQIVGPFGFSSFINFVMHLDILLCLGGLDLL
jgi:hypothetical protein